MAPRVGPVLLKARIYSATLGRFLQTDPIGYGDGMNMYGYVGGDPVNATDPSGNATCTIVTGSRIPVCSSQAVDPSSLGFAKSYGGGGGGATIRFKITSAIVCVGTSCSTPTVSDWTLPTMDFGNDTSSGSYGHGVGIGGLLGDVRDDIVVNGRRPSANAARNRGPSDRGTTGSALGTDNPYKKMRPHPDKPGYVIEKQETGKDKIKKAPPGFPWDKFRIIPLLLIPTILLDPCVSNPYATNCGPVI